MTAAALLARAGQKILLLERSGSLGGAASTYQVGGLTVEASLHETSDPHDPIDPKHSVLARLGILDALEWVPTKSIFEVRGGPVGAPFTLPDGFAAARAALVDRFPSAKLGIATLLGEMERITVGLGTLSQGRAAFHSLRQGLGVLSKLAPVVRNWRCSLGEVLRRTCNDNEGVKCALSANLPYWHDDPDELWWILFAVAQGGYLASGSRYIRGGSGQLSAALANVVQKSGGEILLSRHVTDIGLDALGRPMCVTHVGRDGATPTVARTRTVIANAAPAVVVSMLPAEVRERFWASYEGQRPSISLFSATFGLSVRPAVLGFRSYSTFLLPASMKALTDFRLSTAKLDAAIRNDAPTMTIVDYSAIDAGLGGPPYPVSVVGVDRLANWTGLDTAARAAKRERCRQFIIAAIELEFPGFAAQITQSVFNTAESMREHLNTPAGAVYGFAPLAPTGPIWRGMGRSCKTPVSGLYLASSYAGSGGFTGAIRAGNDAADSILANRR